MELVGKGRASAQYSKDRLLLAPSIPRPERRGLWHAKPTAATITCINSMNLLIGVVWEVSLQFYMGVGGWGGRELGSAGLAIASGRTGI